MKINPFLTLLSLLLAAVLAYALYYYCKAPEMQWLITIAGGICIFLPWAGTLAVSTENKGQNVNFKVLSAIFACGITGLQLFFALHTPSMPKYILISGILLIIWLSIAYAIIGKK